MALNSTSTIFRSVRRGELFRKVIAYNSRCVCKYSKQNFHLSTTLLSPSLRSFREFYKQLFVPKQTEPPYTHIAQVGDPILRRVAEPVPDELLSTDEIKFLVKLMVKVMRKYDCVGIAAPQIGIPLRVFIMEFKENNKDQFSKEFYKQRQMQTLPLTVFINPKLKVTDYGKNIYEESCGSVKGYCGDVARYQAVEVSGKTELGISHMKEFSGWNARIAQHEFDHLDGKIYTDIMDISTFTCSFWQAVNARDGRVKLHYHEK